MMWYGEVGVGMGYKNEFINVSAQSDLIWSDLIWSALSSKRETERERKREERVKERGPVKSSLIYSELVEWSRLQSMHCTTPHNTSPAPSALWIALISYGNKLRSMWTGKRERTSQHALFRTSWINLRLLTDRRRDSWGIQYDTASTACW